MSGQSSKDDIAVIAIHGVGNHEPNSIAKAIVGNLSGADHALNAKVSEFFWDEFADHSMRSADKGAFWRLQSLAHSITNVAQLLLEPSTSRLDGRVSRVQLLLLTALKYIIVTVVVMLISYPLFTIVSLITGFIYADGSMLPKDEIRWVVDTISPVLVWTLLILCSAVIFLGVVRALISVTASRVRAGLVAVVVTVLEPLLVAVLLPFLINWASSFAFVMLFGGFFGFFSFFSDGPITNQAGLTIFAMIAIVWLVHGVRQIAYKGVSYGLLKIVLDVIRYVGEGSYRRMLQQKIGDKLAKAMSESQQNRVVILAHSLGSIIALDFLCSSDRIPKNTEIILITAGSPYRRLFQFLLPLILFHTKVDKDIARINQRVKNFQWFNVYRRLDYIGKKLKLERGKAGFERSTKQWNLDGHGDYWSDEKVRDVVFDLIKDSRERYVTSDRDAEINTLAFPRLGAEEPEPTREQKERTIQRAAGWMVLLTLFWTAYSIAKNEVQIDKERAEIGKRGSVEQIRIGHFIEMHSSGKEGGNFQEVHVFEFDASGAFEGFTLEVDPNNPFHPDARRFDYEPLRNIIRADCLPDPEDDFNLCKSSKDVEVRFLNDDASAYILPCCAPKFRIFRAIGAFFGIAFLGFWLAAVSSPFLAVIVSVVLILTGRKVSGVERLGE